MELNWDTDVSWRDKHREVMKEVLEHIYNLNGRNTNIILKGGTALMIYHGLDRFSEDLDFDATQDSIQALNGLMKVLESQTGYKINYTKDTQTVQRYMIHYGNEFYCHGDKSLKVEVSYRQKDFNDLKYTEQRDGIVIYRISRLAEMKGMALANRDKIRDIYDICFLIINYKEKIGCTAKNIIQGAFYSKSMADMEWIIDSQKDELINKEKLKDDLLKVYESLDLNIE